MIFRRKRKHAGRLNTPKTHRVRMSKERIARYFKRESKSKKNENEEENVSLKSIVVEHDYDELQFLEKKQSDQYA